MLRRPARLMGATIAVLAFVLAGCGGLSGSGQPAAEGGSLAASGINLAGQTYTVGGQEFDEQCVRDGLKDIDLAGLVASAEGEGGTPEEVVNAVFGCFDLGS